MDRGFTAFHSLKVCGGEFVRPRPLLLHAHSNAALPSPAHLRGVRTPKVSASPLEGEEFKGRNY